MVILNPGFLVVLVMRVLGPLLIFRWPLLGSVLSEFVFDALDVVIWDFSGVLSYINYTLWDKSLDMVQLTIQAIVVWRCWDGRPKGIALSLFGIRLLGFILYELTHQRIFFLIFPNLFVLFFITYLICKKIGKESWFDNPRSLVIMFMVLLFLKMPQELALHYFEVPPWTIIKNWMKI